MTHAAFALLANSHFSGIVKSSVESQFHFSSAIFSSNAIRRKTWEEKVTHRHTPTSNYASVRKDRAPDQLSLSRDDIYCQWCCNSDTLADRNSFRMPGEFPARWSLKCECNSDTIPASERERRINWVYNDHNNNGLQWITHNMWSALDIDFGTASKDSKLCVHFANKVQLKRTRIQLCVVQFVLLVFGNCCNRKLLQRFIFYFLL